MSDITIFGFGIFVTLLLCGTLGLLWWAAIEDGKYNRKQLARQASIDGSNSNSPQSAK